MKDCSHSHPLCAEEAHDEPIRRRVKRDSSFQESAKALLDIPNTAAADVAEKLEPEYPGTTIHPSDVWNMNFAFNQKRHQERTSTQQFVCDLLVKQDNGESFVEVLYENGATSGQVRSVFWAYRDNIQYWKENPDVLLFDNTYKTNRFDMPLLEGNGVTGLSTTFNVCFPLLPNESESAFSWVLQKLRKLADQEGIRSPFVILTDFDKALKNAISNSFGDEVTLQICLWHVLKNVAFHIKTKWIGSMAGTAVEGILTNAEGDAPEGETAAGNVASRLLDSQDRDLRLGESIRDAQLVPLGRIGSATGHRRYDNDADGILLAFKTAVYAKTGEECWGF